MAYISGISTKNADECDDKDPCETCKEFSIIQKDTGIYIIYSEGNGKIYCLNDNITHNLALGPAIRIYGASGVTLKLGGNSLIGTNAAPFVPVAGVASPGNSPALIEVINSSEVKITGDSVSGGNIGILIDGSTKVEVDDVLVTGNLHGIVVRNSNDITIKNSELDGTRASLWVINSEVKVNKNVFYPATSGGAYFVGGVIVQNNVQSTRSVEFKQNLFLNNNIFVASGANIVVEENSSQQGGDPNFAMGQLRLGQSAGVVINTELPEDQQETYPSGNVIGANINTNIYISEDTGSVGKNIVVYQAQGITIKKNILSISSGGEPIDSWSILLGESMGMEVEEPPAINGVRISENTIHVRSPQVVAGIIVNNISGFFSNSPISNITIRKNHVVGNSGFGIIASNAKNVHSISNNLEENAIGIFYSCSNGIIRDNNLSVSVDIGLGIEVDSDGCDDDARVITTRNIVVGYSVPYITLGSSALPSQGEFTDPPYYNISN
jgi:hypothetical protein